MDQQALHGTANTYVLARTTTAVRTPPRATAFVPARTAWRGWRRRAVKLPRPQPPPSHGRTHRRDPHIPPRFMRTWTRRRHVPALRRRHLTAGCHRRRKLVGIARAIPCSHFARCASAWAGPLVSSTRLTARVGSFDRWREKDVLPN